MCPVFCARSDDGSPNLFEANAPIFWWMAVATCFLAGASIAIVRPRYARLELDSSKGTPPPEAQLKVAMSTTFVNAPHPSEPPAYDEKNEAGIEIGRVRHVNSSGHNGGDEYGKDNVQN